MKNWVLFEFNESVGFVSGLLNEKCGLGSWFLLVKICKWRNNEELEFGLVVDGG